VYVVRNILFTCMKFLVIYVFDLQRSESRFMYLIECDLQRSESNKNIFYVFVCLFPHLHTSSTISTRWTIRSRITLKTNRTDEWDLVLILLYYTYILEESELHFIATFESDESSLVLPCLVLILSCFHVCVFYLPSCLASRPTQSRWSNGARRSTVTRRTRCSLFARLTLRYKSLVSD